MAQLMTETNTPTMRGKVLRAAKQKLGRGKYQANFEHGQWWVTRLKDGAQWAVVDTLPIGGLPALDFEQVTRGEDD